MRADEVNEESSKYPQVISRGPRQERGSDELSENGSKNKKNPKRERGGKRANRKKQNAARFPKKPDDDRTVIRTSDNKEDIGPDQPKIRIKQRERENSTSNEQPQQQKLKPKQVKNYLRAELLQFELDRLREMESRTQIKQKPTRMMKKKERRRKARERRDNPPKLTSYSNPSISKDDEFIFVHLAAYMLKNDRQFIPALFKGAEKYNTVSDAYALHDFRTHHIDTEGPENSPSYSCKLCLIDFPNRENALHHCYKDSYHKLLKTKVFELDIAKLAASKFPLDENPDRLAMLNAELNSLLDSRLNSVDFNNRSDCFERIEAILKKFLPDINVQLYGSTAYKAALESSDINICVSKEGTRANTLLSQIFYFLDDLSNDPDANLKSVRNNFYAPQAGTTFMPNVAAIDCETGVKFTIIGADHARTSRIKTANLINFYLTYEPKIQKLALIFRQWANWCGLDEPDNGTLPAFTLVICVIYFFQKRGWVPILNEKTDCNLINIPYRFEDGKCFIRRLKSSAQSNCPSPSSQKSPSSNSPSTEKATRIPTKAAEEKQEAKNNDESCGSSSDEEESRELIFEDDTIESEPPTIESASEPPTIEQETPTIEGKTEEASSEEAELEDEESLLETSRVPESMCLARLLVDLLQFYAYELNYEKELISIIDRTATRSSLNMGVRRIAIQDPYSPVRNAARTLTGQGNFEFWKARLRVAYGRLFIGPNELRKMIHTNKFGHMKPREERLDIIRESNDNKLVEVKSDAGLEVFVEDGESELTDRVRKMSIDTDQEKKRSVKLNARLLNHINKYIASDKSRTPSPRTSPRSGTSSPILSSETLDSKVENTQLSTQENGEDTPRASEESTLEESESKVYSDPEDEFKDSEEDEPTEDESDGSESNKSEIDDDPTDAIDSTKKKSKKKIDQDPIFKRMTAVFDQECVAGGPLPKRQCIHCRSDEHTSDACPDDIDRVRLERLPEMKTQDYAWLDGVLMRVFARKKPADREVHTRERALKFIQNFMEMNYDKNSRLELFGSSRNGFGFSGSDLDICLTFAGHDTEPPEIYSDPVEVIKSVAQAFKTNTVFSNIVAITQAKVPIVKFDLHLADHIKFEADISYYNVLAKRNTKLLRTYCLLDRRCEILGYLVKAMVKEIGIGDASRGSLSSYAYILMVIHFLQHEGVLPVLQELHKSSERPSYIVEGYNTWFQEDPLIIAEFMNNRSDSQVNDCLSKLWVKFLRYYTEDFNFERDVVQCQMSGRLSLFEKEWTSKCISIEDPFDHNHNLGAGVSRKMANFIISVLRRARHVFGSFDISMYTRMIVPHMAPDLNVEIFCDILLSKALLTNGEEVPNDRCCRICGKIGHFIKDCPMSAKNRRLAEKNGQVVETPPRPCFVCNEVGHMKKDCPVKNRQNQRQQRNSRNHDRLENAPKLDLDKRHQNQNHYQHDSRFKTFNQRRFDGDRQVHCSPDYNRGTKSQGQLAMHQKQGHPSHLANQSGVLLNHNLSQLKFEHGNDLNSTVNRLNRAESQYYQNVRNTMAMHQNYQARQRAESDLYHGHRGQHSTPDRPSRSRTNTD